jgi:hypothetical protein
VNPAPAWVAEINETGLVPTTYDVDGDGKVDIVVGGLTQQADGCQ